MESIKSKNLTAECNDISNRNNSLLYKLEDYLGVKMNSDESLSEIRNDILNVSARVRRLPDMIEGE